MVENTTMQSILANLKDIVDSLSDEQKEPLLHQLQASEARFKDSKLNLAIIGEYSSGKSTFINALFQKEILATDMQPTTAVPTYITWNNRNTNPSPHGSYAVTVYDKEGNPSSLIKNKGREAFEAFTGVKLPEDPDRLIDAVTTDNRLSNLVSKVIIKVPVNEKYKGICLIDTPGVNPGTEGTADHVRVTQEVLRDSADAAIIMFPADQVYTASFGSFLLENASHLLKHSIFVITKCDMIRSEGGLDELREFVAHHLSQIGVEKPEVHCISAACALDAYLDDSDVTDKERMWQKRFEETIQTIFKEMAGRRSSIVYENVTMVVNQITHLLTDDLDAKRKQLDKTREELASASPQKMEAECKRLLKECEAKLLEKKNAKEAAVSDLIGSAIELKKSIAFQAIDNRSTKEGVSQYLDGFNSHAMSTVNDTISSNIGGFKQSLESVHSNYKNKLNECYAHYHLNVSTAAVNTLQLGDAGRVDTDELKSNVGGFLTGGKVLEGTIDYIDEIFDSDNLVDGVLNLAFGVIALPFAVAGALFNAFRSLDGIKSEAKDRVRSALESNRGKACEKLQEGISKVYSRYLAAAQQMPEKVVSTFSAEFAEAQKIYNRQMQSTNDQIMKLNGQLSQLRMIAAQLTKA